MSIGARSYLYDGYSRSVNVVAWSPDRKYLAAGSSDCTVRVWDAATWEAVAIYYSRIGVRTIGWSLDSYAISCGDGEPWKWQEEGKGQNNELINDAGFKKGVPAEAISELSEMILAAIQRENNRPLYINAVPAGPSDPRLHRLVRSYHEATTNLCVGSSSPDGKYIAIGGYSGKVLIRDIEMKGPISNYSLHTGTVSALAWSPEGKYIASGGYDNVMQVWHANTGEVVCTYRGHINTILDLSWSPDGKYIVSGSWDRTARVLDAMSGEAMYVYRGHSGPVNSVAWSPDRKSIASGSWDHTLQVWEVG
jgi:WD40 repeat protein